MTFDDLPPGFHGGSTWLASLPMLAAKYKARVARHTASRRERRVRPSRAKPPHPRLYAGVPVVWRRAVKAHVRALWNQRRTGGSI